MPIRTLRIKKYIFVCDYCGLTKVTDNELTQQKQTKKELLQKHKMHKVSSRKIFCDKCYQQKKKL